MVCLCNQRKGNAAGAHGVAGEDEGVWSLKGGQGQIPRALETENLDFSKSKRKPVEGLGRGMTGCDLHLTFILLAALR